MCPSRETILKLWVRLAEEFAMVINNVSELGVEFEGSPTKHVARNAVILIFCVFASGFALYRWAGFTNAQVVASSIFLATVLSTLMFWSFRVGIAFIGIVILLVARVIDVEHTVQFAALDVILFLVGMMVTVGLLREVGVFRWIMIKMVKATHFQVEHIVVLLCFTSALLAMAVGEVISIVFIAAIILELCKYLKANPVPLLITSVLATNVGSAGTLLGNPIGVLIAMKSGLSFEDFMLWAFPVSLLALIATILVVFIFYKKEFNELKKKIKEKSGKLGETGFLDEWSVVQDRKEFYKAVSIFIFVLGFIALHRRIEELMGLGPNVMLLAASLTGAAVVMLWKRTKARIYLERDVDWWTLTFFMLLFAKAGALAYTGVTDEIAKAIAGFAGHSMPVLITIILWVSSIGSCMLDNVVLVAALIPVIKSFQGVVPSLDPLWWALLFGGCFGGNITMVGSTANIIALGILEKKERIIITFFRWFWIGLVAGVVATLVAQAMLLVLWPYQTG